MKVLINLHLCRVVFFPELYRFEPHGHIPDLLSLLGLFAIPSALLIIPLALVPEETQVPLPLFCHVVLDILMVFLQLLFFLRNYQIFSALLINNFIRSFPLKALNCELF